MTLFSGVAPHSAVTASQTSRAKSSSVAEKVSGLYSRRISVPHSFSISAPICLISRTAETASASTCGFSMPNTSSRKVGEVAL